MISRCIFLSDGGGDCFSAGTKILKTTLKQKRSLKREPLVKIVGTHGKLNSATNHQGSINFPDFFEIRG